MRQVSQCKYYFCRHFPNDCLFSSGIDKVNWNFQNALEAPATFSIHLVLSADVAGDGRDLEAFCGIVFVLVTVLQRNRTSFLFQGIGLCGYGEWQVQKL